jgi:hypothetical protein
MQQTHWWQVIGSHSPDSGHLDETQQLAMDLILKIDRASGHNGKWIEDEDSKAEGKKINPRWQ